MPGDHGRFRNTAEQWQMDDQQYHPPAGHDNALSQEGAWRQDTMEIPMVAFEGTGGLHSTADIKEGGQ